MKDLNIYEMYRIQRYFMTTAIASWLKTTREAIQIKKDFLGRDHLSQENQEISDKDIAAYNSFRKKQLAEKFINTPLRAKCTALFVDVSQL